MKDEVVVVERVQASFYRLKIKISSLAISCYFLSLSVTSSHLRSRCSSAILADVYLGSLSEVELVVGRLLHQIV